ncbi:DUF1206 domain-containing protein [Georgenia subflava]|uniref:DUF1206 domain-containing protein n=1 Tax=Georgenia subflava TaxID=1622177 RepID=A0A6N7EME6_9MICO|nr:DUF1206 domain-containing protein [Georgenia subflava]MPV37685.1 DUF1206 domain-containing protein [Georgenia subflava]
MGPIDRNTRSATATARSSADGGWIHTLGKVGYAALGIVWLLLGWLALQLALGSGGGSEASSSGALEQLAGSPLGRVLLVIMAVGLLAYAVWQAVEAAWGYRDEAPKKRAARRIGSVAKAAFAVVLLVTAVQLATASGGGSGGGTEEEATAALMAAPGGVALVALVGAGILSLGGYWVYRGVTASFREKLRGDVPERVVTFGRVGHVARGVAVGVLGVLVGVAALRHDPEQAGGIDAALTALLELPLGKLLLGAVALGLICFGVYQVLAARYVEKG